MKSKSNMQAEQSCTNLTCFVAVEKLSKFA